MRLVWQLVTLGRGSQKTIERSVRNAPKDLPLSTYLFHFSSIANRQCWVLKPLLQSH